MTPTPIRKVLSIFRRHRVRALLMGGQACILYGAAEFSRDLDFAILCDPENLRRIRQALAALGAEPIYLPSLEEDYLLRGHACHFRCSAAGVKDLRIDVMAVMRGCDNFGELWARRLSLRVPTLGTLSVLGLSDLVQAKKTQRDKDWLMLRRLLESDYHHFHARRDRGQVRFWLSEMRTPELLLEIAHRHPAQARLLFPVRKALRAALAGDLKQVVRELAREEAVERAADRAYWVPLRDELERLRLARPRQTA